MESSGASLDPLQKRVLAILAGFEPRFILGGGAAIALYLGHRATRDLDLFWEDTAQLGDRPRAIRERLAEAGLSASVVQESPGFVRLRVAGDDAVVILDLVADPTERLERPQRFTVGGIEVDAESLRDMLVNKLCALLSRSELRDLVDVDAIASHGISLDDAIASAPAKDGGFSPLTLAWVLRNLDLHPLAAVSGLPEEERDRIDQFRTDLIERLLSLSS